MAVGVVGDIIVQVHTLHCDMKTVECQGDVLEFDSWFKVLVPA